MAHQRRIKGLAIHRPIVYGNTATFVNPSERTIPEHSHRWTVAVRSAASPPPGKCGEVQQVGGYDDLSYFIKKVSFKLHETYASPTRVIEKPPFEVSETGWGEFEIQIKIFFVAEAAEKVISVSHLLKLHPWTIDSTSGVVVAVPPGTPLAAASGSTASTATSGATGTGTDANAAASATGLDVSSVHSWQFDEVVFNDPTEALYNIMVQNPPTPLPKKPRIAKTAFPAPISPHNGGAFGELCLETESKEGERISAARDKLVKELDEFRARLTASETESKELKKIIEGAA